jgi:hypothetical protein
MKAKHTPGPWFTLREGFSAIYVEARIEGGMLQEVAMCGPTEAGTSQQEANAALVAAAPELLEALQDLIDSHWLYDSHAVEFDGTVMFGPYYDFSGIDGYLRSEFRDDGIEFVVWPAGGAGRKWSAYSTHEGSMWFEKFKSEAEARAVCMKLLSGVMPEHPVSKAMSAIAKATGESQ